MIDDRLEDDDISSMTVFLADGECDSLRLCPNDIDMVQQPVWLRVGHISYWKGQSKLG